VAKPTKMFGKYFNRHSTLRHSDLSSHNSIWTESESSMDSNRQNILDSKCSMNIGTGINAEYDSDDDPFVLTQFNSNSNSGDDEEDGSDGVHSMDLQPPTTRLMSAHLLDMSFASTVSLGSDTTDKTAEIELNPLTKQTSNTTNGSKILVAVQEDHDSDFDDGTSSNSKVSSDHQRKSNVTSFGSSYNNPTVTPSSHCKRGKKRKMMQIHRLLLDPRNQPRVKATVNGAWNVMDSFAAEMDMMIPEPTAMEKLKYHLTEARLPPSRRKTYNYSHI